MFRILNIWKVYNNVKSFTGDLVIAWDKTISMLDTV